MKSIFTLTTAIILVISTQSLWAEKGSKGSHDKEYRQNSTISTTLNDDNTTQLYITECAACHMAYQVEFLPKRSWKKMMLTLEDHFGTDASLDQNESTQIEAYLLRHASDAKKSYGEFAEISEGIRDDETPLRISETRYFKKEHRKIKKHLIEQKEVKSIANCIACHTKADKGDYSERNIFIPNYGKWDD